MKTFCTVFALLFSFLTCYPCADEQPCGDEVTTAIEANFLEDGHSAEPDFCSPFCICSCCHHQMNRAADFQFEVFSPTYMIENVAFVTCFVKTISSSIWQPPRLV